MFSCHVRVRWKALSVGDKAPYEQLAVNDKTRYTNEMAVYSEKMAVKGDDGEDDSSVMAKKNLKKTKKDKDAPKRAKSAYIFFGSDMRETIKQENPDITTTEIMKELGILTSCTCIRGICIYLYPFVGHRLNLMIVVIVVVVITFLRLSCDLRLILYMLLDDQGCAGRLFLSKTRLLMKQKLKLTRIASRRRWQLMRRRCSDKDGPPSNHESVSCVFHFTDIHMR